MFVIFASHPLTGDVSLRNERENWKRQEKKNPGNSEHKFCKKYNWFRRKKSKITGKPELQTLKEVIWALCLTGSLWLFSTEVPNHPQALRVGVHGL